MTPVKNQTTHTPLNVFMVNFDWRDIYRTSRIELIEKLDRDRWNSQFNRFFFFSWAHTNYEASEGTIRTVHKKTYGLERVRILHDIRALISIPWYVYRHKDIRPDVWSTYDFGNVPALWICKKLFGGTLVPVINNQPTIYSATRKFGSIKKLYSWVMERVGVHLIDHVLTLNATMVDYLKNIGLSRDRMTVFSMNTIDRDHENITAARAGVIRTRYHVPNDAKVLLCVARLEAEKNLDTLLTYFAALGEGFVLFILGRGSLEDQLNAQAKDLGIADRVHLPGYVHREDIWNYYKDADLFVLLSNAEALGVVLWEAMYMSVPVIGSNVDGIVESLGAHGERGLVWKHGESAERFAELVARALHDSPERRHMLEEARKYVDEQLKNTVTINTVYAHLVGGHPFPT